MSGEALEVPVFPFIEGPGSGWWKLKPAFRLVFGRLFSISWLSNWVKVKIVQELQTNPNSLLN